MIVRYSRRAVQDLDEALAYVARDRPDAARRMGKHIRVAIASLAELPWRGRTGRVPGTRELVVARYPFIIAYRVGPEHVDVLAIVHGAQRWPAQFGRS